MDETLFTLGTVTGVHGLRGYLKVQSHADSPSIFEPGRSLFVKDDGSRGDGTWYEIKEAAPYKKGIRLLFIGVDRNSAEKLVGKDLLVFRESLPALEEDTYYWSDLISLDVTDVNRGYLGRITSVFPTGSNDVLVVQGDCGEILVPALAAVVQDVDVKTKKMSVKLPEGL